MQAVIAVTLILLIILKVTGVIAWSWWLVLLPLWVGLAAGLLMLVLLIIAAIIAW
jgi:hypothetical protein